MPSNHTDLKKFAQSARRSLREQVAARLDQVLHTDSAALRERDAARRELSQQIAETSKKSVIDRVAYTWFNRFCALRFMDVNRYNRIGVVSPAEGFTQPEILQEAKGGYIDSDLQAFVDCPAVFDLLGGRRPSADPQQEAYRLLLVGTCNALNRAMPFLFEPIADYTELLMPQDLLSEHSILHDLREALTPEACQDVEVIGWLYQFYISERKDEVFEALKQNQKIAPEDIPAATQLFTPHWIVRYLVENSLGRLWMLNHPHSRLVEKMDYYIDPSQQYAAGSGQPESRQPVDSSLPTAYCQLPAEEEFIHLESPEDIKVCDPACGSGHMLTYAFDLLHTIYEEEGYPASDIPRLILEKNLYGIEIDERAGDLAAFALAMKARGKDRRFFSREVQPNICVLENISFTDQELKEYVAAMGHDLFTESLLQTLKQFEQAKNFGSLIRPALTDTSFVRAELERKGMGGNIFLYGVHERVLKVLKQAEFLSSRYHVVVANPPYMGWSGMNEEIKSFAKYHFPISKTDLYSMFIERCLLVILPAGLVGMITMHNWMFITSFEEFRQQLVKSKTILSMIHLGPRAFDSIGGEVVSTTSFVIQDSRNQEYKGVYIRLIDGNNETEKQRELLSFTQSDMNFNVKKYFRASSKQFSQIPGAPIAYWISEVVRKSFENPKLGELMPVRSGLTSGDKPKFTRCWWEISVLSIGYFEERSKAIKSNYKWFPLNAGGEGKRWYGNRTLVINWQNDGEEVRRQPNATIRNPDFYFRKGITWTDISTHSFCPRFIEGGFVFENTGSMVFPENDDIYLVLSYLSNPTTLLFMNIMNPTLHFGVGEVAKLPYKRDLNAEDTNRVNNAAQELVFLAKNDWDSFEWSWDFKKLPILAISSEDKYLREAYSGLYEIWKDAAQESKKKEEEINRFFVETYNLQNELSSIVPLSEITLTRNPHYRYGGNRSEAELEALLLADTMREFISYAVGCMFGRYSLDKPGLILANQGETLQDYVRKVYGSETPPASAFLPDEDNAIPVLEGEWFSDDVCERFKKFLRVTFGEQHYEENLAFIENAIGRDIRSYFTKEFYSQHVKMYQKRPIYWMFSSPKGSFNVLIYMHRYQPDTLSVILNRYLREFRGKLEGRKAHLEQVSISASSSQKEKTAALKEIEGLNKTLEEIRVYERDVLYPLAVQGIQIDLDDGVKVNYKKFGSALAKVSGLSE